MKNKKDFVTKLKEEISIVFSLAVLEHIFYWLFEIDLLLHWEYIVSRKL